VALTQSIAAIGALAMCLEEVEQLPFDKKFGKIDRASGPGLAIMVIQDGVTKIKKGYGLSNLETKDEISSATNFRMASVSKQFTAMALAILEERGKIDRDDFVSRYLEHVPAHMNKIQVRHLVHHLSGLSEYGDELWSTDKSKPLLTNQDVFDYYKQQDKLDFEAGEKHEYSNGGYSLLALVIERAADQGFREFSREHIFIPAGMENTCIIEYPSSVKNQAVSYSEWPFFEDIDFNTGNALFGEDGVYTSLDDMEAWIRAIDNNTLVSASTTKRIFSPVETNSGELVRYGYGWQIEKYRNKFDVICHSGSWVGFNTFIAKEPKSNTWLVAFSNSEAISSVNAVYDVANFYFYEAE
jgi:CubicO group peptidase (beta-lactamase class C family)